MGRILIDVRCATTDSTRLVRIVPGWSTAEPEPAHKAFTASSQHGQLYMETISTSVLGAKAT